MGGPPNMDSNPASTDERRGMSSRVSILVVSYNTRDMTLGCLESVLSETHDQQFELIVIDNASTDGSADAISKSFPEIKLIKSSDNLGFARANNAAAKLSTGEFLLLLNPDTKILNRAIDKLLAFAAAYPDARIWGGRTLFGDGTLNPTSCWRFPSLWSVFAQAAGLTSLWRNSPLMNPEGYGGWARDSIRRVDIVSGCFLLIRRDLWEALGGFDEAFFMYAEEADLCFRARGYGARPLMTPGAEIIHYGEASQPVKSDKIMRLYAGKAKFFKKNWSAVRYKLAIFFLKMNVARRLTGYFVISKLIPSSGNSSKASEWRKVWSRRQKWIDGYS